MRSIVGPEDPFTKIKGSKEAFMAEEDAWRERVKSPLFNFNVMAR